MMRRASIFGGSWINGGNAGSRYANLDYWPENSNDDIGARLCCDDRHFHLPAGFRVGGSLAKRLAARRVASGRSSAAITVLQAGHDGCAPFWRHRWSARLSRFGEYIARSGRSGRSGEVYSPSRPAAGFFFMRRSALAGANFKSFQSSIFRRQMGKRYRNLIGSITSDENMAEAYRLTARGKRLSPHYLNFKEFDALNMGRLSFDMATGAYRQGEPRTFRIVDPKPRLITALPFRDRVAQQAVCRIIAPLLDRSLLPHSFACRPGKGTHAGVRAVQAALRRLERVAPVHVLKTDFSAYFASIDRAVLWRLIEAKISCAATLRVIEVMVPRTGIGLPIGSLTSQIFANLYTGATLDRFLQQELGESYWYRYMDDLVVLGHSMEHLRAVKAAIERYSAERLGLRFSKWSIQPATRGVNFLGYRIWSTHKLLRRQSVIGAKRKIAAFAAAGDWDRLSRFLAAWQGHAAHADAHNLIGWLGRMLDDVRLRSQLEGSST